MTDNHHIGGLEPQKQFMTGSKKNPTRSNQKEDTLKKLRELFKMLYRRLCLILTLPPKPPSEKEYAEWKRELRERTSRVDSRDICF